MKTTEEKARAYDEALERAKTLYENANGMILKKWVEQVFPELKESEDEKVRKELIDAVQGLWDNDALPIPLSVKRKDEWLAWLEKQAEHANFLSKIQVGDKVTRNEDGVLVNLSQLKRVAKPSEDKQKPIDSYCQENCKGFQETGKCFADGECKAKKEAKQKPVWKPTDEQMDALWFYAEQNNYAGAVLTSLYNDLKKLKGLKKKGE